MIEKGGNQMKAVKIFTATVLLLGALNGTWAANRGAFVQSLILPGMGQMSSGGMHTYIGLGFLCAEAVSIHAVFNAMSKADTYQEETAIYQKQYAVATSYDERVDITAKWNAAFTNANKKSNEVMLWATVAGGIWAANALEAFFFSPVHQEDALRANNETPHLAMGFNNGNVQVRWTSRF